MLRVDEHRTHADRVGGLQGTQDCILEKRPANADVLMISINGEPREEHNRNRPASGFALAHSLCCILGSDLSSGEGVVADDGLSVAGGDVDAGGTRSLCGSGELLQPVVECSLAAFERVEQVPLLKRFRLGVRHPGLLEHVRLVEQLVEPGVVADGAVDGIDKLVPALLVERERGAVSEHAFSLGESCGEDEVG